MKNTAKLALRLGMIVVGLGLATALADSGGGSQCCFTQDCGDQHSTACIAGCDSNHVCSGWGACNPTRAKALCLTNNP